MPGPDRFYIGTFIVSLSLLLLWPGAAQAYIGPGAGLELIPMALGMLSFVVAMFCAILLWPFYTLMRWLRGVRDQPASEAAVGPDNGEAATPASAPINHASTGVDAVPNQPQPHATGPASAIASEGQRDGDQASS